MTISNPPVQPDKIASPSGSAAADTAALQSLMGSGNDVLLGPGTFHLNAPLSIPSFSRLRGSGFGTIIQAAPDFAGTTLIQLAADATEQIAVRDLVIDGNKANVAATPHGIYIFNQGPLFPFTLTDAHDRLIDVIVHDCGGDGVRFDAPSTGSAQARETRMRGVTAYRNNGFGVYVKTSSDVKLDGVVAGNNGLDGVRLDSAGNSQLTNIKGFGSGQVDPINNGYGLRCKAGQVIAANISVQDNLNHGALLEAIDFNCVGLTADSNGQTTANKSGVRISFGNCSIVGFTALDRWTPPNKVQAYPVTIDATDFQANVVDHVTIVGNTRNHITSDAPQNNSSGRNITIQINGQNEQRTGSLVVIPRDDATQAMVARRNSATQSADLLLLQDEALGTLAKVDANGVITNSRTGNGAAAFRASVRGDAFSRLQIGNDGAIQIGIDGTAAPDVRLSHDGLAGQIPRLVQPIGVGSSPLIGSLAAKGVPTTNGARLARVLCPTSGVLTDLSLFLVANTAGNLNVFVLDTGDAAAGSYTCLYATGSIAATGLTASAWNKIGAGSLAINVRAGQQLMFGVAADSFTPTFMAHNLGTAFVNATTLPTGFNPATGGAAPKLVATAATVMTIAAGGTITEANMLSTNADSLPIIIARIA